ncbi:MAG TPA: thioredoxin domain-containing protein [Chitinophagaceae bacterium]|nr:thioredoxin domain-containing protein [Chitinophagaceae bacterium]
MKYITILAILIASITGLRAQDSVLLQTDEFEKGLSRPGVQLLDVRKTSEYQAGHIRNSMQADWTNIEEFKNRVRYLDREKPVMVYCAVGGRSHAAAEWLRSNGFSDVQELKGGFTSWKSNSKPVEGVAAVKQMSMEEYNNITTTKDKVLVQFGGEWCPPCKKMEPVLTRLHEENKNTFNLVKIDASIHTDVLKQLKVDAVPTLIVYKDGKETWRKQGISDFAELKSQLVK